MMRTRRETVPTKGPIKTLYLMIWLSFRLGEPPRAGSR
jgi:hypothetical protein